MSSLEIAQLVGYGAGAALHLWIGKLLLAKRRSAMEQLLLSLTVAIGLWHASNLFLSLYRSLGLTGAHLPLRLTDTLAVVTITLAYSLLLHIHLHLWANAHHRRLTRFERVRVYLSYIPLLFLAIAIPEIWRGPYAPMVEKLSHLVFPFALWAAYVLILIAVTDWLIARQSRDEGERNLMRTLAASFILVAALMLSAYALQLGRGTAWAGYLQVAANLGSLLPTSLLAYHIYRYRYLELIIERSLFVAIFAAMILLLYLYGVRALSGWMALRYGLRESAIESLLILILALVAVPLHHRLRGMVHDLFAREAGIYRDLLGEAGTRRWSWEGLPQFLRLASRRVEEALSLKRVRFIVPSLSDSDHESDTEWEKRLLQRLATQDLIENDDLLAEGEWTLARALVWEGEPLGAMLVKADDLSSGARAALDTVARQIAMIIRDCRLIEENLKLERRLAQGERLAALGRMAATIAHEIKNPLSAIKAIAQVMNEDGDLRRRYGRDLALIIGEADRLSRSLNQLLSFARNAPNDGEEIRADALARYLVALFQADAAQRNVVLDCCAQTDSVLDGRRSSAVRDALANLVANALQATPSGGRVSISVIAEDDVLSFRVKDTGTGIPAHLRERIWEPFFTTRQRGTGLGLAIARKRMEEIGGEARLVSEDDGPGACFELRLKLSESSQA